MSGLLDREAILDLLGELGRRLDQRGVAAEVYVVGGTAMVLAYDRTRLTRDIGAVWDSDRAFDEVVAEIPRVFDEEQWEALNLPGLAVTVASARHMIAMKARAARDARDLDDLLLLCAREGLLDVASVLGVADEVWGPGMLRDETVFALRQGLVERGLAP